MKTLLTTLLLTLTLLLTACGSKSDTPLLTDSTIETTANAEVFVPATEGADSYHWKQLSGITVEISDADSQTLRFRAPSVTQEERLVFGLEAIFGDITQTVEVTVIVKPLEGGEDNGTTTPGGDDNSTGGGSDDNGTTGGGSDTNTTTPDTTPPVITLKGKTAVTLTIEDTYTELGATALDAVDGNVSVTTSGTVDTSTVGSYTLTYSASDHAGNKATATRTITIQPVPVTLQKLTLTIAETSLNRETNTTLKVEASYDDNTTKDVTDTVEWLIDNPDAIQIQNHTLTAKQDINTTLRAKLDNQTSNAVTLDLYWEVDGYRLPSQPDNAINDATLGGVDANSNGVRDDVERKIYATYPVKLQRALMIDEAKYFQKIILMSADKARELKQEGTKNIDCKIFLRRIDKDIKSDDFDWITFLENNTINTKQRVRKYLDYNLALSGGTYGSSPSDWNRDACSEEIQKVLEEMGL